MTKSIEEQIAENEERIKRMQERNRKLKRRQSDKARKARTHRLIETAAIYEKATGIVAENEDDRVLLSKMLQQQIRLADGTTVKLGDLQARVYDQLKLTPEQRVAQSSMPTPQHASDQPRGFTPNPSASSTGQERSSRVGGPSQDGAALALLG